MDKVEEDTYLGVVISSDGRNMKTIKLRIAKGLGIISEIMNILEISRLPEGVLTYP